jgi:hypothetical protein
MADETINLILNLGDSSAVVQQLTKDLDGEKAKLNELVASYQRGDISISEFMRAQGQLSGSIGQTRELLNGLTGRPGSGRNAGQGLLGASYAVQDFTSQLGTRGLVGALGAVQNNIPSILSSLGVGAGLTGVISIAAVALGALLPLIQKAFGGETEEMIERARKKLEEWRAEIDKVHDAFIAMTEKPTAPESEFAENIQAIFDTRGNADKVRAGIAGTITPAEIESGLTEEEKAARTGYKAGMTEGQIEDAALAGATHVDPKSGEHTVDRAQLTQIRNSLLAQRRVDQAVRNRLAEGVMKGAVQAGPAGDAARRRLGQAPLPEGLARELAGSMPDIMAQSDAADEAFEQANEDWRRGNARRQEIKRHKREAQEEAAGFHAKFDQEHDGKEEDARMRATTKQMKEFIAREKGVDPAATKADMGNFKELADTAKEMGANNRQILSLQQRSQNTQGLTIESQRALWGQVEELKQRQRMLEAQAKSMVAKGRTAQSMGP